MALLRCLSPTVLVTALFDCVLDFYSDIFLISESPVLYCEVFREYLHVSVNHTNDLILIMCIVIRNILASPHPLSMETFQRALGETV